MADCCESEGAWLVTISARRYSDFSQEALREVQTLRAQVGNRKLADVIGTGPQSAQQVIDTYFMEHRAKLVDIAAYLDRIDRGQGEFPDDFRDVAFRKAIAILTDGQTHRAKRILELFSDHTTEIPQSAEGMKGAAGAVAFAALAEGDAS